MASPAEGMSSSFGNYRRHVGKICRPLLWAGSSNPVLLNRLIGVEVVNRIDSDIRWGEPQLLERGHEALLDESIHRLRRLPDVSDMDSVRIVEADGMEYATLRLLAFPIDLFAKFLVLRPANVACEYCQYRHGSTPTFVW